MIFISWNICGVGNDSSRNVLSCICRDSKPDMLCIIEPQARFSSISNTYWQSLHVRPIAQNDRGPRSSNIWVFASSRVMCSLLFSSPQCVVLSFEIGGKSGKVAFVHGASTYIGRRILWADLLRFSESPILFIGDFNAVRGAHERRSSRLPDAVSCREFLDFIDSARVEEVPASGLFYSWSSRRYLPEHVESKLDRALASDGFLDLWFGVTAVLLPRISSDHSPLVVSCLDQEFNGPRPFRFLSVWTAHEKFAGAVRTSWSRKVDGRPLRCVMNKLKNLRNDLRVWNKDVFGNCKISIATLQQELQCVQMQIAVSGYTEALFDEEVNVQAKLESALSTQASLLRQKCRVDWLQDGDRNTSFFHRSIQERRATNSISAMLIEGAVVTDLEKIADHVVDFYKDLFSSNQVAPTDFTWIADYIPRDVNSEMGIELSTMPSWEEVKSAVFSLNANSAAGPDGYSGSFFHSAWDIIAHDIFDAVSDFFRSCKLPAGLNSSFVVLLPKEKNAMSVTDFRPIVLSNFLFKIISKILAVRLNLVASKVISLQQFGFIEGRRMHDAILLASEGVNAMFRINGGRNLAFKIDICKAFDTLRWDFIIEVLHCYGFPDIFCSWILEIFASAKLSILVNGVPKGYFSCSRGVRQGDPLSPILFGIAEDVLSRLMSKAVDNGQIAPMNFCRGVSFPSHILYADDIIIFCSATTRNIHGVAAVLQRYATASGQICNPAKSKVYYAKVVPAIRACVKDSLGFGEGRFPFRYLGVPIFKGMPRQSYLRDIVDGILDKFERWNGRFLSMAGRLCLVKSVIVSSGLHAMYIYKWPRSVVDRLDLACRNFIWTGSTSRRPVCSVVWNRVCALKEEGGLGVISFRAMNDSLLIALAWRLRTSSEWVYKFLRQRYFLNLHWLDRTQVLSSIWPALRSILPVLDRETHIILGDGSTALFWLDDWLGFRIVDRLCIPVHLHAVLRHPVSTFLYDGIWHFTAEFIIGCPDIVWAILCIPILRRPDQRVWRPTVQGMVSPKLARLHSRVAFPCVRWSRWIWSKFIPVRRTLVCWRVVHGRMPTMDMIRRMGFVGPGCCLHCLNAEESVDHLFMGCSFAISVWQWLFDIFQLRWEDFASFNQLLVRCMSVDLSPQLSILWQVAVVSLVWGLWMSRNKVCFDDAKVSIYFVKGVVRLAIKEADARPEGMGSMRNSITDFLVLRSLRVKGRPVPIVDYIQVIWELPPLNWVKINTDGAAKGQPGIISCGGVFRCSEGSVLSCFHWDLGIGFAFEAEIMAVIISLEFAKGLGLAAIWLESDSTFVVGMLSDRREDIPWRMRARWLQILEYIGSVSFRVSHVFREGNQVADRLAGDLSLPSRFWFTSIPCIYHLVNYDLYGSGTCRVMTRSTT